MGRKGLYDDLPNIELAFLGIKLLLRIGDKVSLTHQSWKKGTYEEAWRNHNHAYSGTLN